MKVTTRATVLGAQFYDILDEKTGAINRYTSVFTYQPAEAGKPDRCGFVAGKLRGDSHELVRQLSQYPLPMELELEVELSVNAKGESKPRVLRLLTPPPAAKKAA